MKKQKIGLLLFAIIVLSVAVFSAARVSDSSKIDVILTSQTPDPVEPGSTVELRFTISNNGGDAAADMEFEVLPEYPFSLYKGSAVQSLGTLQPNQKGSNAAIVYYKLKVDDNAVEGDHKIDIRYKFGKLSWVYVEDFIVRVRTADAILSVDSIESYPSEIVPGETAKIDFNLKNLADSIIRDIKIKIDLSSSSTPFSPIKSTTEKKLSQISSNESAIVSFEIIATPSATAGIYKIPVNISYTDGIGTKYSKADLIGLIIGSRPDIMAYVDSYDETTGAVIIKIVNKGLTNVKLMHVKLGESKKYTINSPEKIYIGNIDTDDYETADFKLILKSSKDLILPLTIAYMDANNNQFTEERNISLKTTPKSIIGSIIKGLLIIIVIVGIGLFIYWRFFWKKKIKLFSK